MSTKPQASGMKIVEVRVRNFRSLQQVDVHLDQVTVLIGGNNSGKTSFLDALNAAIGAGRRIISDEDVFLGPSENKVPRNRSVTIDLLIRPTDGDGNIIDGFPEGSYWLNLWGNGVSQDEADNDFVAIRTQMRWDANSGEYVTERRFLGDWQTDSGKWGESKAKEKSSLVSAAHIEPLVLYYLDAKRDIQDELQNRGSFWHRLVSDPGLTEEHVTELEAGLSQLNESILSGSAVFAHVQDHLNDLYHAIECDRGSVSVSPIPRHLRHLSKGMDVNFATKGAQNFPLTRHGMGTRSLAALLTFRAYMTWRQKNTKGDAVHPMLALEEPEAHLHPQAQRALFKQIEEIPGQRIISTHSPYIAGQACLSQFRHFRKVGADTRVTQMDTTSLTAEDIRKIDRMVMNTRGEILYARALVFFEGETEEQALPVLAERYWQRPPSSIGITFVGVGGDSNYLPFLRLASSFSIPWFILSDGQALSIHRVQAALSRIGILDYSAYSNIVVLPNGYSFESYLVSENYEDLIVAMLDSYYGVSNFVDSYIARMDGKQTGKMGMRDYKSSGGRERALVDILSEHKPRYATPIAASIAALHDLDHRFPKKVKELFQEMSNALGLEVTETAIP